MLSFIWQKILNKKWLVSCLLAGAVLLIAIACCNPMYTNAALQKTLTDELEQLMVDTNRYPAIVEVSGVHAENRMQHYYSDLLPDYKTNAETLASLYKHEAAEKVTLLETDDIPISLVDARDGMYGFQGMFNTLYNIEEHINIMYGSMFSDYTPNSEYVECIVSERTLITQNIIVGDIFETEYTDVKFKVVGAFTAAKENDLYWVNDPLSYEVNFFIPSAAFDQIFMDTLTVPVTASYFAVFDYRTIGLDELNDFIITDNQIRTDCSKGKLYSCSFNFEGPFMNYREGANKVKVTMWVFQIPVLILLCVFIFMVSNQIISIEQSEIAMLKSRGVSKRQLILSYLMQSGIISVAALVVGIPLGYIFCTLFGATRSFLEFSVRTTIEVNITLTSILYAIVAAIAAVLFMTLPVLKYANFSIVEQKTNKKKHKKPLWQMVYLDFILLALSLYGFYSFQKQREVIIENITDGSTIDPLLYFSSTVFILAIALIFLRIIPLITGFVYKIGAKKWSPASFASFMQINRNIRKQSFIIVFLVLTLALGIFNATTARSINDNEEMRLRYDIGADLVVQQTWSNNMNAWQLGMAADFEWSEPDFTVYNQVIDKTNGLTKVFYDEHAGVNIGGKLFKDSTLFMAVTTDEFGKIAYMPDGVTKFHWYYYLNKLAVNPYGAIISRNYAEKEGLKVGDSFTVYRYEDLTGRSMSPLNLTVSAIVDAWPAYEDSVYKQGSDGSYTYTDNYLVVVNYDTAVNTYNVEPYQIWMDVDDTGFFYEFAEKNHLIYSIFKDAQVESDEVKEQPFFQVTSGMLTIAFLVVLVLSMIGFLIYWVTSIKSRELLFGIYRAMGMSMSEIIHMLIFEHLFGSLIPILYGVFAGILSARMFVPLIQLAYSPQHSILETLVITAARDMIGLSLLVVMMLVICFVVIGRLLSKMKITQALKLGED